MYTQGSPYVPPDYLGLQGFRVSGIELREKPGSPGEKIRVVTLDDQRDEHQCWHCKRYTSDHFYRESEPILVRDCSMGDYETFLEIYPHRVQCCGHSSRERLPFQMEGFRMTRRFFFRVGAFCHHLAVAVVAKMARLAWDTVARIDKAVIELGLGGKEPSIEGLRHLGVDEVSRTGGRIFFTVFTDLETGHVVHIADGRGKQAVKSFTDRLTKRDMKRIKVTASDMGYFSLLQKAFPRAQHVLDRFHIVKLANDRLNEVRRRIFGGAPKDPEGKQFKNGKWLLQTGGENIKGKDKGRLAQLLELNRPIYRAYILKEELRAILNYSWKAMWALRRRLRGWFNSAGWSQLPEFKSLGKLLRGYAEAIVAGFETDARMGVIEGTNRKIVKLRVTAHGYRMKEYFKLKIYQRCNLQDSPYAEVIL